jgi:hypothetical protein
MEATIGRLQAIPDVQYRAILRPYAEAAAAKRSLAVGSAYANDVEAFLDAAVQRKADLLADLTAYHKNVHRAQGRLARKNRPAAPAPLDPELVRRGGPQGFVYQPVPVDRAARVLPGAKPADRDAAKVYTGGSYSTINGALRTGRIPDSYRATVDALDRSMDAPKEVVTLLRGTDLPGAYGRDPSALVGRTMFDDGFTSTSVGDQAAFTRTHILQIVARPETARLHYARPYSGLPHENEAILARGTHLYVHAVEKVGSRWIIKCEVVSPEWASASGTVARP